MKIKGKPVIVNNADGRLEVFVMSFDSAVWHAKEDSNWAKLGNLSNFFHFTVGQNQDGSLEVFAVDWNKQCWHIKQTTSNNSGWSDWSPLTELSTQDPTLNHQIAVARNQDGWLELFSLHDTVALYHIRQTSPNNGWETSLSPLTLTFGYGIRGIELVANNLGCLQIFGLTEDYCIIRLGQFLSGIWKPIDVPGGIPSSRKPGTIGGEVYNLPSSNEKETPSTQTVASPQTTLKTIWQNFSKFIKRKPHIAMDDIPKLLWEKIATNAGDFRVIKCKDGRLELFWLKWNVYHCYQNTPDGDWSATYQLPNQGLGPHQYLDQIEVLERKDGCIEVYAIVRGDLQPYETYSKIYHIWQITPTGEWSTWEGMGYGVVDVFSVGINKDGESVLIMHDFSNSSVFSNTMCIPPFLPDLPAIITASNLPDAFVKEYYSVQLQANNVHPPYSWTLKSNILQDGLSLDTSTGLISGTPIIAGQRYIQIEFNDTSNQPVLQQFSLRVNPQRAPVIITESPLIPAMVGQPYSTVIQAQFGATPYIWLLMGGSLPSGLSLNVSTISGTALTTGPSNFTIQCRTGTLFCNKSFELNVNPQPTPTPSTGGLSGSYVFNTVGTQPFDQKVIFKGTLFQASGSLIGLSTFEITKTAAIIPTGKGYVNFSQTGLVQGKWTITATPIGGMAGPKTCNAWVPGVITLDVSESDPNKQCKGNIWQ